MRPDTMPPVGALVLVHAIQPTIASTVEYFDPPHVTYVTETSAYAVSVVINGRLRTLATGEDPFESYADSWEVMP